MNKWDKIFAAIITIGLFAVIIIIGYFIGLKKAENDKYFDGYSDAMIRVVKTLVTTDEVRIGNLTMNEPNQILSKCTFFVLDPNITPTIINGANMTGFDCYYEYIDSGIPISMIEELNRFNSQ